MAIIYGKNACGSCFQLWDCLVAESQNNQFDKSQLYQVSVLQSHVDSPHKKTPRYCSKSHRAWTEGGNHQICSKNVLTHHFECNFVQLSSDAVENLMKITRPIWIESNRKSSPQRMNNKTSWWFRPIWKILVKMGIFSKWGGENKKYLKPPPRKCICNTLKSSPRQNHLWSHPYDLNSPWKPLATHPNTGFFGIRKDQGRG